MLRRGSIPQWESTPALCITAPANDTIGQVTPMPGPYMICLAEPTIKRGVELTRLMRHKYSHRLRAVTAQNTIWLVETPRFHNHLVYQTMRGRRGLCVCLYEGSTGAILGKLNGPDKFKSSRHIFPECFSDRTATQWSELESDANIFDA